MIVIIKWMHLFVPPCTTNIHSANFSKNSLVSPSKPKFTATNKGFYTKPTFEKQNRFLGVLATGDFSWK